jgi:hypothetical protein
MTAMELKPIESGQAGPSRSCVVSTVQYVQHSRLLHYRSWVLLVLVGAVSPCQDAGDGRTTDPSNKIPKLPYFNDCMAFVRTSRYLSSCMYVYVYVLYRHLHHQCNVHGEEVRVQESRHRQQLHVQWRLSWNLSIPSPGRGTTRRKQHDEEIKAQHSFISESFLFFPRIFLAKSKTTGFVLF